MVSMDLGSVTLDLCSEALGANLFSCLFQLLDGKDPDAGRDWGQEEKETTEDEMAGWHH